MSGTTTLEDLAVTGRRVLFTYYRELGDGPEHPGIITGTEDGDSGALRVLVRIDGTRSPLSVPADYEGLTYLPDVVDVPALPMGPFTPTANEANGFFEHDGVLLTAVGEDGEDVVVLTDDEDKALEAAIGYGPELGFDSDYFTDIFDPRDAKPRWVVFEWQLEDAECPWLMNTAAEGDPHAVHIYYLPTS
jgi:hypothetical protein